MKIDILGETIEYYIENNNKQKILFLHGLNSSQKFLYSLKNKKRTYDIVSFDFPGNGLSTANNLISIENYQKITEKFIEELKLNDLIVLGHSLGAASAVYVGKMRQVKKVVLVSPFTPYWYKHRHNSLVTWIRPRNIDELKSSFLNLIYKPENKKVYYNNVNSTASRFIKKIIKMRDKNNYLFFKEILNKDYLYNEKTMSYYKSSKRKQIVIQGKDDLFVSWKSIEEYKKKFHVKVIYLEKCGHSPIFEKSDEVNQVLNSIII
ncbi:MAG: alpha/beta hydrolase [Mycoplasma sp.]|nr:alpha/beta hydrolase [Mycoplasma sp.]